MQTGPSTLHERYRVQADWTAELRHNLLKRIELPPNPSVLEVGSGTGCITTWMSSTLGQPVWGVDIDLPTVRFAHQWDQINGYAQANGHVLPFPDNSFDLVFSHFLLLWTPDPAGILREMTRCVRKHGWVIAFAEPDYGGRIDYPAELISVGELQTEALRRRGAAPLRGRELRGLFAQAGLQQICAGVLGGEWEANAEHQLKTEWAVLRDDLGAMIATEELAQLEVLDRRAWDKQERTLFIPTFFAMGQKPH